MKKKYNFLVFFCLAIGLNAVAQENISSKDTIIGQNLLKHTSIKANKHSFNNDVYDMTLKDNQLYVQTRKMNKKHTKYKDDSYFLKINPENNAIMYQQQANYNTTSNSFENSLKEKYIFIDTLYNIGITYDYDLDTLRSYDLYNDTVALWSKALNSYKDKDNSVRYPIENMLQIDDTTIVFSCGGLKAFNIINGNSWTYNINTIKVDSTPVLVGTIADFALGVLFAFSGVDYNMGMINPDAKIKYSSSNTLYSYPFIYLANKDSLYSISTLGSLSFKDALPQKRTSSSNLFLQDSTLYLLSLGSLIENNEKVDNGDCFLISYDTSNGKQHYLLDINKDYSVLDYKVQGDSLSILFENKLFIISLSQGKILKEYKHSLEREDEAFATFAYDNMFIKQGSYYKNIQDVYPNDILLFLDNKYLNVYDDNMKKIKTISYDDIYFQNIYNTSLTLIANKKNTYIIDDQGLPLVSLDVSFNAILSSNKHLYDKKDNSIIDIDLSNILR
jgi:hypothetical protein